MPVTEYSSDGNTRRRGPAPSPYAARHVIRVRLNDFELQQLKNRADREALSLSETVRDALTNHMSDQVDR